MKIVKQTKLILSIFICLNLASCSTYSNKFGCADAKGLNCMMLSDVDARVDSGEIEEAYKGTLCKGKKCKNDPIEIPELASNNNLQLKFKQGGLEDVE